MSLYDEFDKHRASDKVAGWSSGIKLLQSQLQLKKAAVTQPKREQFRKATTVLPPVIDLKSKASSRDAAAAAAAAAAAERDEDGSTVATNNTNVFTNQVVNSATTGEYDWNVINEYDPLWPNEYEKVVKELRDIRDKEYEQEAEQRKRRRETSRFEEPSLMVNTMVAPERDEERTITSRGIAGGAAIAPPPSLQESAEVIMPLTSTPIRPPTTPGVGYTTSSVAAKIMAKYGFKEGQGLGKKEQGMSVALQVEKTSKRGGRIVSEKEQLMPPPPAVSLSPPPSAQPAEEPTITEIMKSPSKVVLLRNMVGPGEVDADLEPEVKDECNTKYGDVGRVLIHEVMDVPPEEAVRIFVEFKRIESAIKAVVDLNGRFFGGRQVKAGFYSSEKLDNLQLMD
ncbi:Similar to Rbm17: Splicing factor 45 (Mus musculus) [Cotesia congregata]|uniref:Splicing factor 45 n=1 Tax=Cotesia congregata TaxID=51543 RepID=A0A8J2HHK1_COTCN|nr:Similar to Rbm17: Splicing factor 45 (Mus musculus) [Cotesia congregata]